MVVDYIKKEDVPMNQRYSKKKSVVLTEILDKFFNSNREVLRLTCDNKDGNYSSPRSAHSMIARILRRKGITNYRMSIDERHDWLYIIKE